MDKNSYWNSEISHVANNVSKSIGIIRKSSFYLSTKTLRTLYTERKYGGALGQPGSSGAKARLVRPQGFCFDSVS